MQAAATAACAVVRPAAAAPEPLQFDGTHPPTTVLAPNRRIIAVGDLHGDMEQTKKALRLARVLGPDDGKHQWIGGTSVLVQVGDVLDRGDDEIAILSLLRHLDLQARSEGGAVLQLNGNHEAMNVSGEFNHVSKGGFEEAARFAAFSREQHGGDWPAAFSNWQMAAQEWKPKSSTRFWLWNRTGTEARSMLFSPGGPLASELSRHGVVLKINGWLFAHGGILPHHVSYGLDKINLEVSKWMKGNQEEIPFIAIKGYDSIVWSRLYSHQRQHQLQLQSCAVLETVLSAADAKALIVGHTPQLDGVNSGCENKVWRIDVGMCSRILHADPEVLEIEGNEHQAAAIAKRSKSRMGSLGITSISFSS